MIVNIIYVIFAILGLSFLIFIHELGHYWMARRVGMRVETFSIGFGKPLYTWERDGVTWKIGWLLFGGYVKIGGTETDNNIDPYSIPDGFFGKSPWARIKVAFMGPLVNLLFALALFALLWVSGGREKSFAEFTHKIGWVDPASELYAAGVRPGDEIVSYDDNAFQSWIDHYSGPMLSTGEVLVTGYKMDYKTGERVPFEHKVTTYPHPKSLDRSRVTAGILDPASFVIYDRLPDGEENSLLGGSPLLNSGIRYGDRILWVDGELIFSSAHLSNILNDGRVLLTVERGNEILLRRAPRVPAQDLRPDAEFREELLDWKFEAGISNRKFRNLYVIPYNLDYNCTVENVLRFIDKTDQDEAFPEHPFSSLDAPLRQGDKIIAVQGKPVSRSFELLKEIQEKRVNIIVQRDPEAVSLISWKDADASFNDQINSDELAVIAQSIGKGNTVKVKNNLHLLDRVTPKVREDFPMSEDARSWLAAEKNEKRRAIEEIDDIEKRQQLLKLLETSDRLLVLGLPNTQDRRVTYNPKPTQMFSDVANQIGTTFQAIFSGTVSPKMILGPVGIVQVVQTSSMISFKESMFWIGVISLNLGILNLLPFPILDGGTIVLSFIEMVSSRRIKPKVLEKVNMVFVLLLMVFFVFLTYNDLVRVFGKFLN